MVVRHSDELFQLIKSLSKSEKRYFRLSVSPYNGEKKYLLLFDAMDAQQEYDEAELKERFRDEKFVRQFNVAKRYLYEQIMKALRNYHAESGQKAQIRTLLRDMEILHERGLSRQARKVYDRIMEMAIEQEDFHTRLELLNWWQRLEPDLLQSGQGVDALYGGFFDVLDRFRDIIDFEMISNRMALPVHGDHPRTPDELAALEQGMAMLGERAPQALSVRGEIMRCSALATYHYGQGDYQASLEYTTRVVDLFGNHRPVLERLSRRYISALSNKLILHKNLKQEELYWSTMHQLRTDGRELLAKNNLYSRRVRADLFRMIYMNLMTFNIARREYSMYGTLAKEVEAELPIHRACLEPVYLLKLYHNMTLLYFDQGEYSRALDYNLEALNMPDGQFGQQTYYGAKLMNLIIHYELGNLDLLEYLLKSAYRYFKSRQIMFRFETVVLEFFRRLLRSDDRSDLITSFSWLREHLMPLADDPQEQHLFRLFGYFHWIDANIAKLGLEHSRVRELAA